MFRRIRILLISHNIWNNNNNWKPQNFTQKKSKKFTSLFKNPNLSLVKVNIDICVPINMTIERRHEYRLQFAIIDK